MEKMDAWERRTVVYRRLFHKYPEPGWLTFFATIFIAEHLEKAGFKLTLVVFFHNKSEPCNNDMAPKLHYFSFFFKEDRVKIVINSAAANAIQPAKTFGPIFANVS